MGAHNHLRPRNSGEDKKLQKIQAMSKKILEYSNYEAGKERWQREGGRIKSGAGERVRNVELARERGRRQVVNDRMRKTLKRTR